MKNAFHVIVGVLFCGFANAQNSPLRITPPADVGYYQPKLDNAEGLFVAVEGADAVLHIKIVGVSPGITTDVFAETFSVMELSGRVATPSGVRNMNRNYLLRENAGWSQAADAVVGTEWIFIIKGNREVADPILRMHSVVDGVVLHHGNDQTLVDIDDRGNLATSPSYNTCEQSEFLDRYNARADLREVLMFTCADGSQWRAGNDRPADYVETPVTVEKFMNTVSRHLNTVRYSDPNLSSGFRAIAFDKSLKPENRLDDMNRFGDDVFRFILEETP